MENIKLEDIQTIFNTLNKSKLERKGYILLPDFEGFKLFEIDEERLKLYLQAESLHIRAVANTNNENGALPIPDVSESVCPICYGTGYYSYGGSFGGPTMTQQCTCRANVR